MIGNSMILVKSVSRIRSTILILSYVLFKSCFFFDIFFRLDGRSTGPKCLVMVLSKALAEISVVMIAEENTVRRSANPLTSETSVIAL
jgi:hypothetical protein